MSALAVLVLALLVGVSLGAVGGGGSVLTVPILVYLVGERVPVATTTSLLVVAAAASLALVRHWRAGRVAARAGALVALSGLGGTVAGSWVGTHLPDRVLLVAFAALMAAVATALLRRPRLGARPGGATCEWHAGAVRVVAVGTAVGELTGVFGVGGGFIVVPALVLVLDVPLPCAVGTSLLVVTLNATVAFVSRVPQTGVDWRVALPFSAVSIVGAIAGSVVAERVDAERLGRWLAALLLVVAAYVGVHAAWVPA